jgi:hypothetical protein
MMAAKQNSNHDHDLLTPEELTSELKVTKAWLRDHVSGRRKPLLPHIRLGDRRGQIRFRRVDIDAFLKMHTRNQEPEI